MKKKILFVTQNLGRTGSEMVLWYLIENLDRNKYSVYVFCLTKGELFNLLPDDIEKSISYRASGVWHLRLFRSLLKMMGLDPLVYQLRNIQKRFKADLWYINTIVIPFAHRATDGFDVKVITHFHELLHAFEFIKAKDMQKILSASDVCIGCSEEVCETLKNTGHNNVILQHSFIDFSTVNTDPIRIAAIKQDLGILPTDYVFVVAARAVYMKGLDYVLPILEHFKDKPVKILWIGNCPDTGLKYYVQSVADRKYPNKLFFSGPQSADYYNYLSVGNSMLLLSREESFSLVMLEAAYLGIPIVAFKIGIATAFIKAGMGNVIDDRSVSDLLSQMERIYECPLKPETIISLKIATNEYAIENQLGLFEKLIDQLFQ